MWWEIKFNPVWFTFFPSQLISNWQTYSPSLYMLVPQSYSFQARNAWHSHSSLRGGVEFCFYSKLLASITIFCFLLVFYFCTTGLVVYQFTTSLCFFSACVYVLGSMFSQWILFSCSFSFIQDLIHVVLSFFFLPSRRAMLKFNQSMYWKWNLTKSIDSCCFGVLLYVFFLLVSIFML